MAAVAATSPEQGIRGPPLGRGRSSGRQSVIPSPYPVRDNLHQGSTPFNTFLIPAGVYPRPNQGCEWQKWQRGRYL